MLAPRAHSQDLPDDEVGIRLPPKVVKLFEDPYGTWRYRGMKGGRGSAKTRSFALMTAVVGYQLGMNGHSGQILCCRQYQNSLADSSLIEIKEAITEVDEVTGAYVDPWLVDYWEIGETYIRSRDREINYNFMGLARNLSSLKSTARILLCWVEEAEHVSEKSWATLIPTVREEGSEIWLSWNPETRNSATDKRFIQKPSDDMLIIELNYTDNPFFPKTLEKDRLNDLEKRPDTYRHIWHGEYYEFAEGAYFIEQMRSAEDEARITNVPHDPALAVFTAWDLGISDSTAIWFYQRSGMEVRIINFYENEGFGLSHYVAKLDELGKPGKHNRPGYRYAGHVLPHDVKVRELGTGKSRLETLESLGVSNITVCPALDIEDGIEACRNLLPRCWFDKALTERGVLALKQYRREYDEDRKVWKAKPHHDWASHPSDAFRYLAVGMPSERSWGKPVKRNVQGVA
jgi:phage terminase large subunit